MQQWQQYRPRRDIQQLCTYTRHFFAQRKIFMSQKHRELHNCMMKRTSTPITHYFGSRYRGATGDDVGTVAYRVTTSSTAELLVAATAGLRDLRLLKIVRRPVLKRITTTTAPTARAPPLIARAMRPTAAARLTASS